MDAELLQILGNRQPEAYKQTKPYLAQIVNNNKQYIKAALSAIRSILKHEDYKVYAKLNALRFARDCFQTGNPLFVKGAEQYLLESMKVIAKHSNDQSKVSIYADRKYVQKEELAQFKSYLVSMFTLDLQCIKNWAIWKQAIQAHAPNPFLELKRELEKNGIIFPLTNEYFKEGTGDLFIKNYEKFIQKQPQNKPPEPVNIKAAPAKVVQQQPQQILNVRQKNELNYKQKVQLILEQLQNLVQSKPSPADNDKYHQFSKQFEAALDDYVDHEQNFQEEFVNEVYELFEELTKAMKSRITLKSQIEESKMQSNMTELKGGQFLKVIPQQIYREDSSLVKSQQPPSIEPRVPSIVHNPMQQQSLSQFHPPSLIPAPNSAQISSNEIPKQNEPQKLSNSKIIPPQPSNYYQQPPLILPTAEQKSQISNPKLYQTIPSPKNTFPVQPQPRAQFEAIPLPHRDPNYPNQSLNESRDGELLVYSKVSDLPAHTRSAVIPKPKNALATQPSQVSPISQLGSNSQLIPHSQHSSVQRVIQTPAGSMPKPGGAVIGGNYNNNLQAQPISSIKQNPQSSSYRESSNIIKPSATGSSFNAPSQLIPPKPVTPSQPVKQPMPPARVTFGIVNEPIQYEPQTAKFLPIQKGHYEQPMRPDPAKIASMEKRLQQLSQQREIMLKQTYELERKLQGNRLQSLQDELRIEKRELQGITEEIASLKEQVEHTQTIFISSQTSGNRTPREKGGDVQRIEQKEQPAPPRILGSPDEIDTSNQFLEKLSEGNLLLFKRCILRDSQVFYKGGVELQLGKMELVSKGINQYLEIKLIATLKNSGNVHPNILLKYINTTDADLWIKPILSSSTPGIFSQDIVAAQISNKPMCEFIRGTADYPRGADTFFLPIRFFSYLKAGSVTPEHFSKALKVGESKIVRSKILKLNTNLISRPDEFKQYLDCHFATTKTGAWLINSAYLYDPKQILLLVSIELLSNQRAVFRVLQLDDSCGNVYAKQLVNDFVFLFSI